MQQLNRVLFSICACHDPILKKKNNVLSVQEGQVRLEIFSARHHYLWKDWIEEGPFMNVSFTSGGILSSMTTLALSMDSRTSASKYYSFDRSNAGDVVARLDSSTSSIALRADYTNTEELRFWRIKNGEISGASSFYEKRISVRFLSMCLVH